MIHRTGQAGERGRPIRRVLGVVTAAVLLASLSSPAADAATIVSDRRASGTSTATSHDVSFVAAMVPHHMSGIALAEVVEKRAASAEVRALARRIDGEQSWQVEEMNRWLARHDADATPPPKAVQDMDRQDLQLLRSAKPPHLDMMFLLMMRRHHAQGVAAAEDELRFGDDDFALHTAHSIKTTQTGEIADMNRLLAAMPHPMAG